jgi:hypothetical protein
MRVKSTPPTSHFARRDGGITSGAANVFADRNQSFDHNALTVALGVAPLPSSGTCPWDYAMTSVGD